MFGFKKSDLAPETADSQNREEVGGWQVLEDEGEDFVRQLDSRTGHSTLLLEVVQTLFTMISLRIGNESDQLTEDTMTVLHRCIPDSIFAIMQFKLTYSPACADETV